MDQMKLDSREVDSREVELLITFNPSKEKNRTSLQIQEGVVLEELIEFLQLYKNIEFKNFQCYSEQKQQNLKLDENFKYVKEMDTLIISAEIEFIVELDIGGVIENKLVRLSQLDTIKDLKENLQKYLNEGSKQEQINFEIYKDGFLQTDEGITIYNLLNLKENLIQPKIKAKSNNQNCLCSEQNNKKSSNKQEIVQMQTDSQLSELQLLKELINSKFKILEMSLMKTLEESQKKILKELEFYERDIRVQKQLQKESNINNSDWIYQKFKSFKEYKKNCLEHVQFIVIGLKKFQFNLLKEQEKINQQYKKDAIPPKKLMKKQQSNVNTKNKLQNLQVEIAPNTTFNELIEYFQWCYPIEFNQYTQVFGPTKYWRGFSQEEIKDVSLSDSIDQYQGNKIKFGPFHIIRPIFRKDSFLAMINMYGLKNECQV